MKKCYYVLCNFVYLFPIVTVLVNQAQTKKCLMEDTEYLIYNVLLDRIFPFF